MITANIPKNYEVEPIAPAMGTVDQDQLSLADFRCLSGYALRKVKQRKPASTGFSSLHCHNCPQRSI